jgi:hypothetical protein
MYFGSNFDSTYKQNSKFGFGSDLLKNIKFQFWCWFWKKKYQFKSGSYYGYYASYPPMWVPAQLIKSTHVVFWNELKMLKT